MVEGDMSVERKIDLTSLLNPKSICIIGATENSLFVQKAVNNLKSQGFDGKLYMVNPKYKSVFGYPVYPSVLDIPEEVENAIVLVPAKLAVEAASQCAKKGVKSITIITSGFAENGRSEGRKFQEQIKEITSRSGILLCGPNCFGTISPYGQVANFCEKIPGRLGRGSIGIVMQSGALTASIVNLSQARGIDFSFFVSSGNEAGLESSDYFRFFLDDPHTDVICGFIEGIQDKRKFTEVADQAIEKKKPIILIKIGSTNLGVEVAFRHTGATAGSDSEFKSICQEKGITRVDDFEDLIETASLFSKVCKKWPHLGRRVGVLTVSGGGAGLVAEIGSDEGFEFPKLSQRTSEELAKIIPEFGFVANPLDVTTQVFASPSIYSECVGYLLNEKDIDMVIFPFTQGIPREPGPVSTIIEGLPKIVGKTGKLCVLLSMVNTNLNDWSKGLLERVDIPFIQGTRRGFKAIKSLIEFDKVFRKFNKK
jgi:acetyltransferase